MPTCNYEIDYFTVTKDGTLKFDDRADSDEVEQVLEGIAAAGFECEPQNGKEIDGNETAEITAEEPTNEPQGETVGCGCPVDTSCEARSTDRADRRDLTVEIPLDKVAVGNLTKLLEAKGSLIKKALGVDDLRIEVLEDRVAFPWFSEVKPDEALAYTNFITKLCMMAKEAKRVNVTEKKVDNEKYAFRCFLLRLGFIGAEYKADRKILLKNLTGSSAFKNGGAEREVSE
jgi:hypothetical protein